MKKGWKTFWIVCIVLAVIGIVLCIAGVAAGATLYGFRHWVRSEYIEERHQEVLEDSDITAAEEAMRFSDIKEIEVDTSLFSVEVRHGDEGEVIVYTDELSSEIKDALLIDTEGDALKIELKKNIFGSFLEGYEQGTLIIELPEGLYLKEASFSIDAGELFVENITAEELSFETKAGSIYVEQFQAEELEIECGAGSAEVTGDCKKEADIHCGVGSVIYRTTGAKSDYNYELKCRVGTLTIGDEVLEGLANKKVIDNGSRKNIDIECGVGEVEVYFQEL